MSKNKSCPTTLIAYRDALIKAGVDCGEIEGFNTNNAWGFGGGIGTHFICQLGEHKYDIRKGTASFRHLKSEAFFNARGLGLTPDLDPAELLDRAQNGTFKLPS